MTLRAQMSGRTRTTGLVSLLLLTAACTGHSDSAPAAEGAQGAGGAPPIPTVFDGKLRAMVSAPKGTPFSKYLSVKVGADGEPRFEVFVRIAPGVTLPTTGDIQPGTHAGTIATASVSRDGLFALAKLAGVEKIELSTRVHLTNEIATSASSAQIDALAAGESKSYPFTVKAGQSLALQMHKGGPATQTGAALTFTSVLKICKTTACTGTGAVLASSAGGGPGGDAIVRYTFATAGTYFARASEQAGRAGPFAIDFIGDQSQPYLIGTGARALHAQGKQGQGVIVGMIDTGIDFCHPDFIDDTNLTSSRILSLWDHGLKPIAGEHSPAGSTRGVEYSKADIDASLAAGCSAQSAVRMRDINGHGTHTAGTAAGDGSGSAPGSLDLPATFMGAAPKADIIAVRALGEGVDQDATNITEAIQYITAQAKAQNKPVVINMSLGGFGGSLDGTTLFEQAVSQVAGPGRIVVVSAGNAGVDRIHGSGVVAAGAQDTVKFATSACASGSCGGIYLNFWHDGKDAYDFTVKAQDGTQFTVTAAQMDATNGVVGTVGGLKATIYGDPIPEANGDRNIVADIARFDIPSGDPDAGPIPGRNFAAQNWTFTMKRVTSNGSGKWDAYSPSAYAGWTFTDHVTRVTAPDGTRYVPGTVSEPGTAHGALTVGASGSTFRWFAQDGTSNEPYDGYLAFKDFGALAYFSSRGPTRDGRVKPDVTAPGLYVISSASRWAKNEVTRDTGHLAMAGTSMAAPNVTGAVALILQADPTNFPRPLLKTMATRDKGTGQTPDGNQFGAGKVNVVAALQALNADTAPVASGLTATPTVGQAPVHVALGVTASDSDPGDGIAEYLWDFDGDGLTDKFTTVPTVETDYTKGGSFTPSVTAVDHYGRTAQSSAATPIVLADAPDAGAPDSGTHDSGTLDSGVDSGNRDGGNTDGGSRDGGHPVADGGANDSGEAPGKDAGMGTGPNKPPMQPNGSTTGDTTPSPDKGGVTPSSSPPAAADQGCSVGTSTSPQQPVSLFGFGLGAVAIGIRRRRARR